MDLNKAARGKVERWKREGGWDSECLCLVLGVQVGGWWGGLGGVYVFLELRLGVEAVYDFRVTTRSLKFSAALFFPPESNSPCTAEIDSRIEECALSKQFAPLTV